MFGFNTTGTAMRVDVYNRKQIEKVEPRPNVWVISITTPGDDPATLKDGWEGVERFCFSDIAGDSSEMLLWVADLRAKGTYVILFDEKMAQDIREIVALAKYEGKDLIVHCDAGVSRSQAIARFAREIFGADVVSHTIHTDQVCNGLVIRHLYRIVWMGESRISTIPGSYTWQPDE